MLKTEIINNNIKRISNGNMNAIDSLFIYTIDNMRKVAKYYCYNVSDIDDVLSDLYMNVVKYSKSFKTDQNGYNWMVQIVKNLSFKYNKQSNKMLSIDIFDSYLCYDNVDSILLNFIIEEAILELTSEEKELIRLLYWDGNSPKEIAERSEVPLSTLYSRLNKIHKKIKKHIIDS